MNEHVRDGGGSMGECQWTERVAKDARAGGSDPEVRAHMGACEACRELDLAVRLLGAELRVAEREALDRVPPSQAILRMARAARTSGRGTRLVLWPVVWAERLGAVASVVVIGWLGAQYGRSVARTGLSGAADLVGSVGRALTPTVAPAGAGDPSTAMLLAGVLVILAVTLYVASPGSQLR